MLGKASQIFAVLIYWFGAAQQTSTVKMSAFIKKKKKTVRALRVNETKCTSEKAFIVNIFALKREKESKIDKRTLFGDCPHNFNLKLEHQHAKNCLTL